MRAVSSMLSCMRDGGADELPDGAIVCDLAGGVIGSGLAAPLARGLDLDPAVSMANAETLNTCQRSRLVPRLPQESCKREPNSC